MKEVNLENQNVVEAEYEEIDLGKEEQKNVVPFDMSDVAYMLIVGRKKDGKPFLTPVGVQDLFVAKGLIDYGVAKIEQMYVDLVTKEDEQGA